MKVWIRDWEAVQRVTPIALSAYATAHGWTKTEAYGDYADVYVADGRPEILIPRTTDLGDYASVVTRLIEIFSETAEVSQIRVYQDLTTADRDVIRVRARDEGSEIAVEDGVALVEGARNLVFAAACSVTRPQPLYRAEANEEATKYLRQVRMGQTEPGSFVVTLLTPTVVPPVQEPPDPDWPVIAPPARAISKRLIQSLVATRRAVEATASRESGAFKDIVEEGVSANLCEAIADLTEVFPAVDIGVSWALTLPTDEPVSSVGFAAADAAIVRAAARMYREREPQEKVSFVGFVSHLWGKKPGWGNGVTLQALRPDSPREWRTVTAILGEGDDDRAVEAHDRKLVVIAAGDLHRIRSRWHLRNPHIEVLRPKEESASAD